MQTLANGWLGGPSGSEKDGGRWVAVMKVVLFCGGMGMRLRDYSERLPKPLIDVGPRPIIWHIMKYYAHYGHREFILCLGHGGRAIKEYFLTYDESATNDFVLSNGGKTVDYLSRDIDDWTITFVDTGINSLIGERLRRVREHLGDDPWFLANYADGLCDLSLDTYVDEAMRRDKIATFLTVPAPHTFHIVHTDAEQYVDGLELVAKSTVRVNAGYFVFKSKLFDHLEPGDELVDRPFSRLIAERELVAVPHDGFWRQMDTFKDKVLLDEIESAGKPPWRVWD
jgi:glucose-1-phosphate cytidylyltransferase